MKKRKEVQDGKALFIAICQGIAEHDQKLKEEADKEESHRRETS